MRRPLVIGWLALAAVLVVALGVGVADDGGPRTPEERARNLAETVACPACDGQHRRHRQPGHRPGPSHGVSPSAAARWSWSMARSSPSRVTPPVNLTATRPLGVTR